MTTTVGVLGGHGIQGAVGGYYYYDMPVAISGKQMGQPNNYAKQDRNNIKKGGSTGGLLVAQNSYPGGGGVPGEYNSGFLIHYDYNHYAQPTSHV